MRTRIINSNQGKINKSPHTLSTAIAVIGMGVWYPGASDLLQLWENVLARLQQFRRLPKQRLPLSEYYDPDSTVPDKTYGTRAAVIDGFEFDWASKRIPKTVFESTDVVHWLALEIALKAMEDARADGDYVYAVLRGWGISSDGKGGITAPSSEGQAMALRRAYERAGYSPRELDFIEGHGTATPVGDRVELEGMALGLTADGEVEPVHVA